MGATFSLLMMKLIELDGLARSFAGADGARIRALRNVTLSIAQGEFICITGPSGSGKSTLLNLLGCMDRPTAGSCRIAGRETGESSPDELALIRRQWVGFVFQSYSLIDGISAKRNVELAGRYAGMQRSARSRKALRLLESLGLADRVDHRPADLSGGEQQRVAIARALMTGSRLILADEPTGAMDEESAGKVLATLKQIAHSGHTVVLATHDDRIARHASRRIRLLDGRVVDDSGQLQLRPPPAATHAISRNVSLPRKASVLQAVGIGLEALGSNLRQGALQRLTMAVLGISAAVWLGGMSLLVGEAVFNRATHAVNEMGLETITVIANFGAIGRDPGFLGLTLDDAAAIRNEVPNVRAVSPLKYSHGVFVESDHFAGEFSVQGVVDRGNKRGRGHFGHRLADGEFITSHEDEEAARVVVLASAARDKLFPQDIDAVGQEISVRGTRFRVKGVYEQRRGPDQSEEQFRAWEEMANSWIYMPFQTFYALLAKHNRLFSISVFLESPDQLFEAAGAIRDLGIRRHNADVYFLEHSGAAIEEAKRQRANVQLGIGGLAAVALLAGTLGIMSIMLVSIRARRREIGIRMAMSAHRRDIFWQFLAESATLGLIAGVLGVLVTLACIPLINRFGFAVGFPYQLWIPFVCALLTGLIFGIVPARRAAQHSPVSALNSG